MSLFLQIIFWLCVVCLLHSYLIYPGILRILAALGKSAAAPPGEPSRWPHVSAVMAVYNEEAVMEEKLQSLLALDYPNELLDIYIGSDCSSDQTNSILASYSKQHTNIHFFPFEVRRGKPGVINKLVELLRQQRPPDPQHIYLLTDASVMLTPQALRKLVRHFEAKDMFMVDANMVNTGLSDGGIARSESKYVQTEVRIKHLEGQLWGTMLGPFGGCYALRSNYFEPVPPNFLVDDFYIAMRAFEQGGRAINDLEAICYEAVPHDIWEEYRRKARISAGNFQNLATFKHLLKKPFKPLGFAFLSHKVLRWLGPFFIIFALVSSAALAWQGNLWYHYLLYLQLAILVGVPLLDYGLKKLNIHLLILRNITYFFAMNAALLEGFFNYLKGIKTNVWQPPKRQ